MITHSPTKFLCFALLAGVAIPAQAQHRNIVIFVADGLRPGSVNATDAPTMLSIRQKGVNFANSHALFPTFTTPNSSAIATGHYLGDTGDFSNTIYSGYPIFNTGLFGKTAGTVTPFVENDPILCDLDAHYGGNYLTEETLLALARKNGYNTAAIGKLGPAAIQDASQLEPAGTGFAIPSTVIIDDATGSAAGVPLSKEIADALTAAGMSTTTTARNQPSGNNTTPGTLLANVAQQQYFADATTKAVLPAFKASGKPFAIVYWSRDPDGSQHNNGDSLNALTPGINGPTSKAGVHNADNNLKQILDYINSDPALAANTDIFLTADHGFATISRYEVDNAGHHTASYAAQFTYKDSTGRQEVNSGFLPTGFVAIDLAHTLGLPLFDPDNQVAGSDGTKVYAPVDPTIEQQTDTKRQRPGSGDGLIGGTGKILQSTDAKVIVAANGGSDLIYVPDHDAATVHKIVAFLLTQDYTGAVFVDDMYGAVPGALPLSSIRLIGSTKLPRPAIALNFKTFATDADNPLQTAVQVADTTLQEGQGMHGTLSRDNTFNNMAAIGPDFKKGYTDRAPVSNADLAPTLAHILGLKLPSVGSLTGRVITEALAGAPADPPAFQALTTASVPDAQGRYSVLSYQQLGSQVYFDASWIANSATKAVAKGPAVTIARMIQLDASSSTSVDGKPLTYSWQVLQGSASIGKADTAAPVVTFLGQGVYQFQLTVTDSSGASSTATVSVNYAGVR